MKHIIKLVDLIYPCTACIITDNLLKEVLAKVSKMRGDVEVEFVVIQHPSELKNILGVEVEKLPLIIIDDEQVSAGNFITPREIIAMLSD